MVRLVHIYAAIRIFSTHSLEYQQMGLSQTVHLHRCSSTHHLLPYYFTTLANFFINSVVCQTRNGSQMI